MEEYFILIAALLAEIIGTMAGFGSSTIFLPIALLFLDFKTALVIVAILHIFGNIGRITFFKKGLDLRLSMQFGIPSVIMTIIGASAIAWVPADILKMILGLFLIVYSIQSLKFQEIRLKPTIETAILGGGISGFLAGLIGTGGAIRGTFLNSFNLPKTNYIATAAFIAILVDSTRLPLYIANGFFDPKYYVYVPFLLLAAFTGSFIGKTIVSMIDQETFRKLVLIAIALSGIKFITDFFM
ncbi:sulfite exporter TauE/SafE family protein [Candidatus Micrarchaeota archaeon]|nr:sulfite exporter TauE/SafE family protein [Candidatus Micrarchaeota archaeon]